MSKRYIHVRTDLADLAALEAASAANPPNFPVGGLYSIAGGVLLIITENDGTTPVVGTVTVVVV